MQTIGHDERQPTGNRRVFAGLLVAALAAVTLGAVWFAATIPGVYRSEYALALQTQASPAPLPSGAVRACDQSLLVGRVAHSGFTLTLDRSAEAAAGQAEPAPPVVWPFGFSARLVGGKAEIVGPDQSTVATEGDVVQLGGGLDAAGTAFNVCSIDGRIWD